MNFSVRTAERSSRPSLRWPRKRPGWTRRVRNAADSGRGRLTGSKTDGDEFDEGLDGIGPGDESGGLPDGMGMDGFDEAGSDDSGDLDDLD
jgi:hypothetical protein